MVSNICNYLHKKSKKELITGIFLSVAVNFLFFFYAPLEILFLNKKDLFFSTGQIIRVIFPLFLMGTLMGILVMAILWLISEKAVFAGVFVYAASYLCTYVQGTFLLKNIPYMNGRNVEWDSLKRGKAESYLLWIIMIVLFIVLIKKLGKAIFHSVIRFACVFITLVLIVTEITLYFQSQSYLSGDVIATSKNMLEMSTDKNFIILVLDSVNTKMAYQLFHDNEEYQEVFEDFTYYPNMIGAYGETRESVTFILSGDWYENDEDFNTYRSNAYRNSPLFSKLENKNYIMGLYTDELAYDKSLVERFDNVSELERGLTSYWGAAGCMVKLAGYRYGFFDLKRYFDFDLNECYDYFTPKEYSHTVWENKDFYDMIEPENFSLTDEPVFKYIHIRGAHVPWNITKDLSYDTQGVSYETMVEVCFDVTGKYLEELKELGVYDNSVIIVMADHGYNMEDQSSDLDHQTPFFCVKGIGEHHSMEVSDAPVSYADLQDAFLKLLDGNPGNDIFEYHEGDERERRYLFFESGHNDYMIEIIQRGHAFDIDGFQTTGTVYE